MDYAAKPLRFRFAKAVRYVRLYGPERTLAKIRGQYHSKRKYDPLPATRRRADPGAHVGIIGCGNFAFTTIAYYLDKNFGKVIRATMDTDIHRAASLFEHYKAHYYADDAEELINDPAIDLIYISSNHASHATYAIRALAQGKSVHIEKPHVVSMHQLHELCSAMRASPGRVALGFNRPDSVIGRLVKSYVDAQSGPAVYNWFVVGHEIPDDHWYARREEGGRVFGNLCHWTDFVLQLVPSEHRYPITIRPTRGVQSDCDIAVTYTFGDGTIAAITFSAKGETFEGVRERFSGQRGDALIAMADFQSFQADVIDKRRTYRGLYRDHGHEQRVCRSYRMVGSNGEVEPGASVSYVWETGELFIRTRDALEQNETIVLQAFSHDTHSAPLPASS